jgi:hypothetical protein
LHSAITAKPRAPPICSLSSNHLPSISRAGCSRGPVFSRPRMPAAPCGATSGNARRTSRTPRPHRWPMPRTGTCVRPGIRSFGSSRLSPPYGWLTSSSPGRVPCAERRPSGYSRYSGNRRLCFPPGRPSSFEWAWDGPAVASLSFRYLLLLA